MSAKEKKITKSHVFYATKARLWELVEKHELGLSSNYVNKKFNYQLRLEIFSLLKKKGLA